MVSVKICKGIGNGNAKLVMYNVYNGKEKGPRMTGITGKASTLLTPK